MGFAFLALSSMYYLGSWGNASVLNPSNMHSAKLGKQKHAKVSSFMRNEALGMFRLICLNLPGFSCPSLADVKPCPARRTDAGGRSHQTGSGHNTKHGYTKNNRE